MPPKADTGLRAGTWSTLFIFRHFCDAMQVQVVSQFEI